MKCTAGKKSVENTLNNIRLGRQKMFEYAVVVVVVQ